MKELEVNSTSYINLGFSGESYVTKIKFDTSLYTEGITRVETATLFYQRPGENSPYPVSTEFNDGILTWTVTDVDTEKEGYGYCQLFFNNDYENKNSPMFQTYVSSSLGREVEPPEPQTYWVNQMVQLNANLLTGLKNPPKIDGLTWWIYDYDARAYVDTGMRAIGQPGPQGEIGPQGIQGPQGDIGPIGPEGPQGVQGERGLQGIQGEQGIQGIQGIQGPVGPQGPKGDSVTGPQGPKGPKGDTGDTGPQGPQGVKGDSYTITQADYQAIADLVPVEDAGSLLIITEDMVTVTTDSTKGVAPYSTSYGYTNITIDLDKSKLKDGVAILPVINTKMVVASGNRNVRIRFGTNDAWHPVCSSNTILDGDSYFIKTNQRIYMYSTKYYDYGAFHLLTDSNSTYSTYSLGLGYGTCATAEATLAKVVTHASYTLVNGGINAVKFDYNVKANSTMNINANGAKPIYYKGAAITDGVINAGDVCLFVYTTTPLSGGCYELLSKNIDIEDVISLQAKVKEIELAKFPNVTIYGTPTITQGQMSNFSANNYAQFPFIVNFQDKAFTIDFDITTGSDITSQHNVFDSAYGLAFAVRNSKFILAYSTTGTGWDFELTGSVTLAKNTNYRVRITWDKSSVKILYSTNGGSTYTQDATRNVTTQPYPKQILIGVSTAFNANWNGIINLNNCSVTISEKVIWTGMDDVGLATRMAVDMSNIDEAGVNKVKEIASEVIPQMIYVVESGTDGVWKFRKFSDGRAEIWTEITHSSMTYPNSWTAYWKYSASISIPAYPSWFTLENITGMAVSDAVSNSLGIIKIENGGTAYTLMRPDNYSGKGKVHLKAYGTWQ